MIFMLILFKLGNEGIVLYCCEVRRKPLKNVSESHQALRSRRHCSHFKCLESRTEVENVKSVCQGVRTIKPVATSWSVARERERGGGTKKE